MFFFEFLQEFDKSFNSILWHGVVDTCPQASYTLMALEVIITGSLCSSHNFCIELLAFCNEWNIHQGSELFFYSSLEHGRGIQEVIHDLGFVKVLLMHYFQAAHILQVLEYFSAAVDGPAVRSIVHTSVLCMCLILEIDRKIIQIISDPVLPYDHDYHTGRSYVLLDTGIDQTIIADIAWLTEEHGRLV